MRFLVDFISSYALFCWISIIAKDAYICQEEEKFLNLTDSFSISVKLRENRCHLSNIPYKAMQKDSSRHHLSRRAGSSFFTFLYSIGDAKALFSQSGESNSPPLRDQSFIKASSPLWFAGTYPVNYRGLFFISRHCYICEHARA